MDSTLSYFIRRLLWVGPILLVVTFATFSIARWGPGNPISVAAGQFRDEEAFERILAARGLDKPIPQQYVIYMKGLLTRGDLGESFRYQDIGVRDVLLPALWRTMQYNSVALTITLVLGIPLGIFAARRQGTWADPTSISSFLLLQSIPGIVLVPFLLLIFSLELGWLPARGWPQPQDCNLTLSFLGQSYECIGVLSKEAVIPIVALSIPAVASWGRFTRAFTLDVLKEDYVRTARAKGISERQIITRHVMRNALLPLSTLIAFAMIGLLEGSFFIETLTGVPGVGRLAFESVGSRDYDMIMAITIIGASAFVMMSIAVDMIYVFIDPRIRYGARRN